MRYLLVQSSSRLILVVPWTPPQAKGKKGKEYKLPSYRVAGGHLASLIRVSGRSLIYQA